MSCRIQAGPEVPRLSPLPRSSPIPRPTESESEWEGGSYSSLFLCNTLGEYNVKLEFKTTTLGASLVVQGTRICLPMQRTRVRSLVQEDSKFCGATKARTPQLLGPCAGTAEAHAPRACVPLEQTLREAQCRKEEPLPTTTRESLAAMKTQHSQKVRSVIFKTHQTLL